MSTFRTLVAKELRELSASPATWLMLLAAAGLVMHAFSTSTALYAEASGAGGGPAALAQGLNPLDGIVVPVLGVYDLVATLLFPFVVIRAFAAERASGAHTLVLQLPPAWRTIVTAKTIALLVAWCVCMIAGALALGAWISIGGHLSAPETLNVVLGHLLRGAFTIGLGAAAAAFTTGTASASIVVLAVTIGSWAVDYVAAARGGAFAAIAQLTPAAALRVFERGELRATTVIVLGAIGVTGLGIAAAWMRDGVRARRRVRDVAVVVSRGSIVVVAAWLLRVSVDVSEDRRNSFTETEEAALRSIHDPIVIRINLAAQDPRLADYERGVLAKLRRVAHVYVEYVASGRTGLFARADEHYGEITYDVGGKTASSRSVAEPIVLEMIFEAAGVPKPPLDREPLYAGYPLARTPGFGCFMFQSLWPLLIIAAWWWTRRPKHLSAIS